MEPKSIKEALICKAKAGDTEAFRELYDEFVDYIFSFVRSRVSSREDALDITQEVFVDFWNGLKKFQFENDAKLRNFLLKIASRKISRFHRFHRVTVSLEDIEDVLPEKDGVSLVDTIMLEELLGQLSVRYREVIELRYFAGLPFAEIAGALGKSESVVKVRHHRAIQKLQEFLNYEQSGKNSTI